MDVWRMGCGVSIVRVCGPVCRHLFLSLMFALGRAVRSCLPVLTANHSSPSRTVFTTAHLHPSIRQLATELAHTQPCFSVSARNVRILFQPVDFYSTLLVR